MQEEKLRVQFANIICRFGEDKVMLDYLDEIVLPAFFDKKLVRTYGKNAFFFLDTQLVNIGTETSPIIAVAGRHVKNTTLESEQLYIEGEGLVKRDETIKTAPSSFFVFILENHRLINVLETKQAPYTETFKSTFEYFLKGKYREFLEKKWKEEKAKGSKKNKPTIMSELKSIHLGPEVKDIPFTSDNSLSEFLSRFKRIDEMKISFPRRNDEYDLSEFFNDFQNQQDNVNSKESTIIHRNPEEGLNKEAAEEEAKEALLQANQKVHFEGVDDRNNKISGDNKNFRLQTHILLDLLDNKINTSKTAKKIYSHFQNLLNRGTAVVPDKSEHVDTKQKILDAYKRISGIGNKLEG